MVGLNEAAFLFSTPKHKALVQKGPGRVVASLFKMCLQVRESAVQVTHLKPESRRLCPKGLCPRECPVPATEQAGGHPLADPGRREA